MIRESFVIVRRDGEKTLTGNSEQIQRTKIIIFQTIGVHWF